MLDPASSASVMMPSVGGRLVWQSDSACHAQNWGRGLARLILIVLAGPLSSLAHDILRSGSQMEMASEYHRASFDEPVLLRL